MLVRLADLAQARLVLSSNWRRTWGPDSDALMKKLVSEGLRRNLWHRDWFVPLFGLEPRKYDELAEWLDDHAPCKALIIDDEYRGPPLAAGSAAVLQIDENEGYTLPDHLAACGFFEVEDTAPSAPPSGFPSRPESTVPFTRPLRPYSPR